MFKNSETYDDSGRLKSKYEAIGGILTEYDYSGDSRTLTMTNERNKSNWKAVLKQKLVNNDYVTTELEEFGEVYHMIKKYSEAGKEMYRKQTNLKTGKIHEVKTLLQNDKPCIWISEYDKEKNVGFFMNKNILTGLTNNT
jgi:hypothetical protein